MQQCIDVLAGSEPDAALAIIPAGTANLLATNLEIPSDIEEAVRIGLHGPARTIDMGRLNGEHFAVAAGAGFDAAHDPRRGRGPQGQVRPARLRLDRLEEPTPPSRSRARIKVDGATWYDDKASCILIGNVPKLMGGIDAFEDARPDDGLLDLGVVKADGLVEWARTLARTTVGDATGSPFVQATKTRSAKVKLNRKIDYELDGGSRTKVKSFVVEVEPGAVTVCVPGAGG